MTSLPTPPRQRWGLLPTVLVLASAFAGIQCVLYRFSAEDAYITARVSRNLIERGKPIYNAHDIIQPFTSPLHMLLEAGYHALLGSILHPNKIAGLLLLGFSAIMAARALEAPPTFRRLLAGMILLQPALNFWAVGGLETPYLMAGITAVTAWIHRCGNTMGFPGRMGVCVLIGLCILARYDSAPFLFPIVLFLLRDRARWGTTLAAGALGLAAPLGWMAFSKIYYGDILPTSFYTKPPSTEELTLLVNVAYLGQFHVFSGAAAIHALAAVRFRADPAVRSAVREHLRRFAWLYAGLSLQGIYALTMATTHMMFTYRSLVPYWPAAALALADLAHRTIGEGNRLGQPARAALAALAVLWIGWIAHLFYLSLNFGFIGEYREIGVRDYMAHFMRPMEECAEALNRHWASRPDKSDRPPRLVTMTGGVLPYHAPNTYVFERLASYRHHCVVDGRPPADYRHMIAATEEDIRNQLTLPVDHYTLVYSKDIWFKSQWRKMLLFYNPTPTFNPLPVRIGEPCLTEAEVMAHHPERRR